MVSLGSPTWSYLFNHFSISVTLSLVIESAEGTHIYPATLDLLQVIFPPPHSILPCHHSTASSLSLCASTSAAASHTRWEQSRVPTVPLFLSRPGMACASWLWRCHFMCPPVAIGLEGNLACWFWSEEWSVHLWRAIRFCVQSMARWGVGWSVHLSLPAGLWSVTSECCLWTFRIWLAQGVSDVLCSGMWVRDSVQLPFQLPPLSFVFPISFEIVTGSSAYGFQSRAVSR